MHTNYIKNNIHGTTLEVKLDNNTYSNTNDYHLEILNPAFRSLSWISHDKKLLMLNIVD